MVILSCTMFYSRRVENFHDHDLIISTNTNNYALHAVIAKKKKARFDTNFKHTLHFCVKLIFAIGDILLYTTKKAMATSEKESMNFPLCSLMSNHEKQLATKN